MKILLTFVFVFVSFAGVANAQLCGQFTTTLTVKSEENKAIENSVVQLLPLGKDETKNKTFVRDENDRSKFSVTFSEGHMVSGKYKVIVSADGFETAEKEIAFPHCKDQNFEFKLKAIKANTAILSGTVYDANGAVIPGAKVTAVNSKGEKFETRTNVSGEYILKLPFSEYDSTANFKIAKYQVTAERNDFVTVVLKDFRFVGAYNGKMHLDFAMDGLVVVDYFGVPTKKN